MPLLIVSVHVKVSKIIQQQNFKHQIFKLYSFILLIHILLSNIFVFVYAILKFSKIQLLLN